MDITEILSNKALKPKQKIEVLCQSIINKEINIKDLLAYAKTAKDAEKGTCIEALEFASAKDPKIINKTCFEFVVDHLSDKAPRVKWECAKIIGNIAYLYKTDLNSAIENLLQNATFDGTVVRWSAAYALVEIIKLETDYNKKLIPKINEICAKEEKPNIKKMYMDVIKKTSDELVKKHYVLGCCGVDCGLCPRFYTDGDSKCPGCFGLGFTKSRPPCAFANCCFKKNKLEACGLCNNFPCNRYENKEKVLKDSFVTHKKIFQNHYFIKENGLNEFIKEQKIRIKLLNILLEKYNDKRSKSYYCLATTLLKIENINGILKYIKDNKELSIEELKNKINEYAKEENVELKLKK